MTNPFEGAGKSESAMLLSPWRSSARARSGCRASGVQLLPRMRSGATKTAARASTSRSRSRRASASILSRRSPGPMMSAGPVTDSHLQPHRTALAKSTAIPAFCATLAQRSHASSPERRSRSRDGSAPDRAVRPDQTRSVVTSSASGARKSRSTGRPASRHTALSSTLLAGLGAGRGGSRSAVEIGRTMSGS
jgi:hypothetical protein